MIIRALAVIGVHDVNGMSPIYPGTAANVDEKIGRKLVADGVAREVSNLVPSAVPEASSQEQVEDNRGATSNAPESPKNDVSDDMPDEADLYSLSFAELKTMAKEMGVYTGTMKSKATIIDAINSAPGYPPDLQPEDLID